jgi:hypothetical protein
MPGLPWALLVGTILLSGCAALAPPPPAVPPVDFTIDAAVVGSLSEPVARPAEVEGPEPAADDPVHGLVGHRFIVFPDGSLHHDVDQPLTSGHLPPLRRVLTRAEMAELWGLAADADLNRPEAAGRNLELLTAPTEAGPAIAVLVGGDGAWWSHRQPLAPPGEVGPPAAALVRRLAELAWAGETTRRAVVAPKRYDFGPDPYARYRR